VELDLHGVDTVAAVRLNGRLLGSTQNMFVRYIFPAKNDLVEGSENILQVEFQSPVDYAAKAFESQSRERHTVPPACVAKEFQGRHDDLSLRARTLDNVWILVYIP
jgi:beta-mannosidase